MNSGPATLVTKVNFAYTEGMREQTMKIKKTMLTVSAAVLAALLSLAIVVAAALVMIAIPGYVAAGVPPAVALED